jgi:prepilin-type N-terminal cleavage/methylation domain-containing protein
MKKAWAKRAGFTIIELIVVIVIISILTAVTSAIYTGIQTRSRLAKVETDIKAVQKLVESYKARTGSYPVTAASMNPDWSTAAARTDSKCSIGTHVVDWVPDLSTSLPQSSPTNKGVLGNPGCYAYVSDGTNYVLSGWNMLDAPQTSTMYRRLGFREMDVSHNSQFYICNHSAIGGVSGSYNIANDYYKRSYTVTSLKTADCGETPPSGA